MADQIPLYAYRVRDKDSLMWSMVLAPNAEEAGKFFKEAALCTNVIVDGVSKEGYIEYCKRMQDPENQKDTVVGHFNNPYIKNE